MIPDENEDGDWGEGGWTAEGGWAEGGTGAEGDGGDKELSQEMEGLFQMGGNFDPKAEMMGQQPSSSSSSSSGQNKQSRGQGQADDMFASLIGDMGGESGSPSKLGQQGEGEGLEGQDKAGLKRQRSSAPLLKMKDYREEWSILPVHDKKHWQKVRTIVRSSIIYKFRSSYTR